MEDEVFVPWRAGVRDLIAAVNANNPRVGWFSPSCEVHTISELTQENKGFSITVITKLLKVKIQGGAHSRCSLTCSLIYMYLYQ